ncbi:MAG: Flp pilus assembly complex ATPase component TadA [Phycisphaerales bacterium]|nr:Flp pilus assembly complex ATPase component TadA [Phycisphaerales bacterium]
MPRLEIKSKSTGVVQVFQFADEQVTIGRQAGNDIVLPEKVASRKHCVIVHNGGSFQVKDLKSHNGTWIGENRVLKANLSFGDSIRIGSTFIRILPDEINEAVGEETIAAEIVEEEVEELPQASLDDGVVSATLAARAMAAGPLSKQLAPLMQACASVPKTEGVPESTNEVRLLSRKSQELAPEKAGKSGNTADAISALRQLLFVAFRTRATDIHVEPKANTFSLRFRIDGLMHNVGQITIKMGTSVLNVIKVLCEIDISKKGYVQEGNFAVDLTHRRVDFRVNFTPTVHGQKLALRFLDKGTVPSNFGDLGIGENAVVEMNRICNQDAGMIILAGPTGSGKTTTLYTALKSIDAQTRNIVTIEDPVEYELAGTTQISIDAKRDLTFASVLSTVLRQDPDVILVGEIRDQETAKMAMQAATTGHLVLTTLHARDTVGTIFRLLDLGVEPFLIASAITACISQRLVRVLCRNCKRPYQPDASQIRQMNLEGQSPRVFHDSVGCKRCMSVGFRGRTALFEMLMFNPQLRDVILTQPTISEIRKAAGEWMFETLTECGYRKVIEGVTTFHEIERVSGMT